MGKDWEQSRVAAQLMRGAWFRSLPPELRQDLLAAGTVRRYARGATLRGPGAAPDLLVILRGTVICSTITPTGQEFVYHVGRPGFWFGMALILQQELTEGIITAHTEVTAMVIPGGRVAALAARYPASYPSLARLPLGRLRGLVRLLEQGGNAPAEARVASRLHHIRRLDLEGDSALSQGGLQMSQALLARITQLSRATVNRVLGDMAKAGIIERGFRSIAILDPVRLARLADLDEDGAS
ncbi:MAG: Crp/Fnr family transcriptional regulator [Geminicoccaceae bacterium]